MKTPNWSPVVLCAALMLLFLKGSVSLAQNQRVIGRRVGLHHATNHPAQVSRLGSSSYSFTYFGFRGAQYTGAFSSNLGATTSRFQITGGYGPLFNQPRCIDKRDWTS